MKKRIALAAVAALAGGLLVAAPASATVMTTASGGTTYVNPFAVVSTATTAGTGTGVTNLLADHADKVVTNTSGPDAQTLYQVAGANNSVVIPAANDLGFIGTSQLTSTTLSVSGGSATLTPATWTFANSTRGSTTVTSTQYLTGSIADTASVVPAGYATTDLVAGSNKAASITVPTTAAGTIVVSVYGNYTSTTTGQATSVLLQTYSIVVSAASTSTVSNMLITIAGTNPGSTTTSGSATILKSSDITLAYSNALTSGAPTQVATIYAETNLYLGSSVTASVSGPALVGASGGTSPASVATQSAATSVATTSQGTYHEAKFGVFSNGQSGQATITLTGTDLVSGAAVNLGSVKVTMYGPITTLTATQGQYVLQAGGTPIATGNNTGQLGGTTTAEGKYSVQLVAKDANGVVVPLGSAGTAPSVTVTPTFANAAVLSAGNQWVSDFSGNLNVGVNGVAGAASGSSTTATFSLTNTAGATVTSNSLTFAIGGSIASETASFDTATYAPGTKAVVTVMAKDSSGNAAYDGQAIDAGWSSNLAAQGIPTSGATTLSNGTAIVTLYAPVASGTWTVSFTAPASASSATVSASAMVAAPATATDTAVAANAAALATLQTAVASLSTTVASLVASMTAQIKVINASLRTLSKAIARIKAKLGIK